MIHLPAFWYEGEYQPSNIRLGWLLGYNDEGEAIVEPAEGGREVLVGHEHLHLYVRCPRCREWSRHLDGGGRHLVGCLVAEGV